MVPATDGPQVSTVERAAAVLQCSRMIRRLGNCLCSFKSVGRKAGSAFKMVIALELNFEGVEVGASEGVEGTSPWRFKTMFCFSISEKTG